MPNQREAVSNERHPKTPSHDLAIAVLGHTYMFETRGFSFKGTCFVIRVICLCRRMRIISTRVLTRLWQIVRTQSGGSSTPAALFARAQKHVLPIPQCLPLTVFELRSRVWLKVNEYTLSYSEIVFLILNLGIIIAYGKKLEHQQ